MDPLTSEQKLDEIYRILCKEESRRKWSRLYSWAKRLIIYGCIIFSFLYPGKVYELVSGILGPIIRDQVNTVLLDKKSETMNSIKEFATKLKDSLESDIPNRTR